MMGNLTVILALMIFSICAAYTTSVRENRQFSIGLVLIAWIFLFPLQLLINEWIPFSGGGDDEAYYYLSGILGSWSELVSPDLLSARLSQPGYGVVLNAVNLAFSPGLVGFKAFNFLCFLLVVLVWSRSVAILAGLHPSRHFAVACVLLTPLWFYFFFLLKDILIVLLMATFLHGLIKVCQNPRSWSGWVLQLVSVVGFVPLRTPLVAQAAAILVIVLMARVVTRGVTVHKITMLAMGALVAAAIVWLGSNASIVEAFGVDTNSRILGSSEMLERSARMSEYSSVNRVIFPLLYLFSETSALSVSSWHALDGPWLRGVLALPWIFLIVPLLPIGAIWLVGRVPRTPPSARERFRFSEMRCVATPWIVVVAFVITSVLISWLTGDTTRWRLADMPALLAVAMVGWQSLPRQKVFVVVAVWSLSLGSFFALYQLIRGV